MNAIILDGQLKSALATVRSLGKAQISLYVGAERDTGMALRSRYTTGRFVYPSPYIDQKGFVACIQREGERIGTKPIVYAFSDATYLTLFAFRKELEPYVTLLFPEEKSVEIAFDKAATYSLARVSGIPTITTYSPETKEEIERLSHEVRYPAVIKTRKSVTWKDGVGMFGSAKFVHTKDALVEQFIALRTKLGEAPLVQDLLLGEEYGVEMIAYEGNIGACVTHHRLKSLSPTGGASVLKETMEHGTLKRTLESYAQTLVEKLRWTGPIMVEFKVSSDTKIPHLMEINGRFWGSLPLSIFSGVDMPRIYYSLLTSKTLPEPLVMGRERVVSNHFLGGMRHLVKVMIGHDKMRPFLYPKRLQALQDFFFLPRETKSDVWEWDDLKPVIMEYVDMMSKISKRL